MGDVQDLALLSTGQVRDPIVVKSALKRRSRGDYAVAAVCVGVLALLAMWWKNSVANWFLIPVMACGILAGVDVVRWLRGHLDLFDPRTIIAFIAFYGFFIAPLLNVGWNTFGVGDFLFWGDWRPWLGAMATLDAFGLVIYRIVHNLVFRHTKSSGVQWEINRTRFYPVFACALVLSIAGATALLWQLHGISGMVEAYENNQEAFVGKGWLLMFAWPLAILSFIVIVFARSDGQRRARPHLAKGMLLLSAAGIGQFLLMGWYGSRAATIWALFWMAGIIHYRFQKLSRRIAAVGVIFLIGFMYFYGFYKEHKREGFEVLRSPSMWLEPKGYQRDIKYLLLGDLARADSNALILHNLVKEPDDYNYRWGFTYVAAFTILIPRNLWPDRSEVRVDAGTEAMWGKATQWRSSRLYGLGGEALLNFGPLGVVPIFGIYGGLVGWYRRKLTTWNAIDARLFLAPLLTSLIFRALVYDSDVLVFAAITEGAFISFFVFLASRRAHGVIRRNSFESARHA